VCASIRTSSEPRVDGFALQREDAEDALVGSEQVLSGDEAVEGFDAERELSDGQ
jgi:hypothetical protein